MGSVPLLLGLGLGLALALVKLASEVLDMIRMDFGMSLPDLEAYEVLEVQDGLSKAILTTSDAFKSGPDLHEDILTTSANPNPKSKGTEPNLNSYSFFSTGIPLAILICAKKHPMIFWPLGHKKIWKKISGQLGQYEFFFEEKIIIISLAY